MIKQSRTCTEFLPIVVRIGTFNPCDKTERREMRESILRKMQESFIVVTIPPISLFRWIVRIVFYLRRNLRTIHRYCLV